MIIKAGSITHLTDARFFAAYDVDMLGFCFDPGSAAYISPAQAMAIRDWISGPQIVAEIAGQDLDNMRAIIDFFAPDIIQLEYSEWKMDPLLPEKIGWSGPLILQADFDEIHAFPTQLLFLLCSWKEEQQSASAIPVMWDITVSPTIDPVAAGLKAIQISGAPETETGMKNFEHVADFLEKLRG